jgi:hypothetical protein
MTGEWDIGGVFAPVLLVWALIALVISLPLRRLLDRLGFYRLVWHRGLFDIALVVLLWSAVALFATHLRLSP